MVIIAPVFVGTGGVRDEVEERVTEKTARCETQQHFQKLRMFAGILQRDEEEDEERSSADEPRRE